MTEKEKSVSRGRAIADLMAWIKSEQTAKALEAMQLLDLSDEDLETLFKNHAETKTVRIPFLGKVK